MGAEILLTPLVAAIGILAAVVVLDARTVFLKQVDVPLELWSSGYSSLVMQKELANAMLDVEREGRAREATRELALEAGDDSIDLVTDYFELTPLVGAFQQSGGFVAYAVDSHVTVNGDNYVLELDIMGRDGSERIAYVTHSSRDIPGFIRQGAEAIMQVVSPEPLCASYLAQAIEGGGTLRKADDCIRTALPMATGVDTVWLHNLAGVVRFMEGDRAGAMEQFKHALRIDPTFSPTLVNVGVLLLQAGQPAEAVKAYDLLFANLNDGVSDRTYGAAYTEWAKTLMALGHRDEAIAKLRAAIAANPDYARAYTELAGLLPLGPEADSLRQRGKQVALTKDQLYTENLIGPVFEVGEARTENLRLCTGSPGKAYIKVGQKLADLAPQLTAGALTIDVVPTAGSLDNLAKAVAGECDAFISQGDAIDFFTRQLHPEAKDSFQVVGELYKELTLLLCRRDSGIDDLDEAQGKVVAAGSMGTGSLATLLNLQQLAPDSYGEIKINPTNGFEGAMAVVNGQAQCLLDVIAPQSDLVKTLNDNGRIGMQLYFAGIDNDDLEDYEVAGSKVYSLVEFDDEVYPNLSTTGDPEMLAISAVLALPRAYAQAHPQAVSALAMLLLTGGKDIEREAYGETKPFAE